MHAMAADNGGTLVVMMDECERLESMNKYNKGTVKKNSADQTTLADFLSPFYTE